MRIEAAASPSSRSDETGRRESRARRRGRTDDGAAAADLQRLWDGAAAVGPQPHRRAAAATCVAMGPASALARLSFTFSGQHAELRHALAVDSSAPASSNPDAVGPMVAAAALGKPSSPRSDPPPFQLLGAVSRRSAVAAFAARGLGSMVMGAADLLHASDSGGVLAFDVPRGGKEGRQPPGLSRSNGS
ncbi:unnamed protein product [Urochloa humidicola]